MSVPIEPIPSWVLARLPFEPSEYDLRREISSPISHIPWIDYGLLLMHS
jgi:hypothetical protein